MRNSGRKTKLNERDRRALKRNASNNVKTAAEKVTSEFITHTINRVSTVSIGSVIIWVAISCYSSGPISTLNGRITTLLNYCK